MHIVLFGAAGQVGSDCVRAFNEAGYQLSALTRDDADFAQPKSVVNTIQTLKPDFIVNACAYTAVDKAESEPEMADLVNHQSVAALAKMCAGLTIPLLHLSTDYVFDGSAHQPYLETDPVQPLGIYGETKLAGEAAIRQHCQKFIVLRTSWVFGENGNNFVKTMLRVGAERDELSVVDDQRGRPTYVGHLVKSIQSFVDRYEQSGELPWGVYHCSSEGETTWYDFAKAIFALALEQGFIEKQPRVLPIPGSDYLTPAPRPAYSVLSTQKLADFMGQTLPHWQQGLERFLRRTKNNL